MDDAMMLPASDTSLAWVYEGATPAMTPSEAATAIQAATLGWTQDDHLQMGALQHHLAVGLGDDPARQAVCSAAAYMHVAAAGLDPGSLLNKGLDPKVLRPKLGAKPEQIGKTRSGKPIYNMFTHPAHASFTTADHVDHIDAMAAHSKAKKMNKAGTPPKLSVVQHAGPKTPGGHPILHSEHSSYAHPIYNHRAKAGTNWGDEEKVKHQTLKDFSHYSAADHDAAHAHHHALSLKQKAAGGEQFQAGLKSSGISAGHQLAASHLRGLQKIKEHPGKSSEWHAGQMGGLRGGNQEHFESHRAASIHLRNMGKSMNASRSKSGGGSRGGKGSNQFSGFAKSAHSQWPSHIVNAVGATRSGKPIHFDSTNHHASQKFSAQDHLDAAAHHERRSEHWSRAQINPRAHLPHSVMVGLQGHHHAQMQYHIGLAQNQGGAKKSFQRTLHTKDDDMQMMKSEAVSILEDFLAKSSASILGRTSSGKAVHPASHSAYSKVHALKTMATGPKKRVGVHDAIQSTLRAHGGYNAKDHAEAGALHEKAGNIHLAEMHNMASGYLGAIKKALSKSGGEGSRGGKVIGHTKSQKPIYASSDAHDKAKSHVSQLNYRAAGKTIANHYPDFTSKEHGEAAVMHGSLGQTHLETAHHHAAMYLTGKGRTAVRKSGAMQNSGTMGFPVDLGDMQGSPIDGSYVDSMGGSHDLFMQQAELANCPTMWAPIATVLEN